jgi:hypothetical protein
MSAHTPGPWEFSTFVDNRPSGSEHHTYKITPQRGVYGSMFEADARLSAAAPDMLEALQGLVSFFDKTGFTTEFLKPARAAISKATSHTPTSQEREPSA